MPELVKLPVTLTRNEVEVELYEGVFGKLSKDNAGLKFPYPVVAEPTFDRDIKMIGKEFVCESMTKILRRIFGGIMVDCWSKEEGQVDQEAWNDAVQSFTEGQEKLENYQTRKNDLSDKFATYTDSPDFTGTPEQIKFVEEVASQLTIINTEIKKIQMDIDAKTAKRNATKAKNAAALAERQTKIKAFKEQAAAYAKHHNITQEEAEVKLKAIAEQHAGTAVS